MVSFKYKPGDLVRVEYIVDGECTAYLHQLCRIQDQLIDAYEGPFYRVSGRKGRKFYLEARLKLMKRL